MAETKKIWVLAVLAFSLVGTVLASLLTWEHYAPVELPGCSAAGTFDCNAVNSSLYSEIRGIPIAFLGLVAYVLIAGLSVTRLRKGPEEAAGSMAYAFVLSVVSVAFSGFLFYVSKYVLGTYCLYCLGLYAVNGSLLVASLGALGGPGRLGPAIRRDLDGLGKQKPVAYALFGLIVVLGAVAFLKPGNFWTGGLDEPTGLISSGKVAASKARAEILDAPYINPGPGGAFAKGSAEPVLTIVEFADFQCPACRYASWELAEFLRDHRDEVRVVFRHYPLDMKCNSTVKRVIHEHACDTAIATEAAGQQGKFWEFHDAVYAKKDNLFGADGRPDLSPEANLQRARKLGLDIGEFEAALGSDAVLQKVLDDLNEGGAYGVTSTPTLFVNGYRISGGRPAATLEVWLDMARNGELKPPELSKRRSAAP